jgi:alpha-L-fucosidase
MIRLISAGLLVALLLPGCGTEVALKPTVNMPVPFGPVPTERQVRWHEMEQYAFVHFGVDTFTDKEWGFGDENPKLFNPTAFDANQIAAAAKAGGMRGLILVAKHHDGLCLWPTKSTPHNITATSYKNGKGDIVKEMSEACQRAGLKFGVYVSPWDRNHPEYGFPGYVTAYHQQISELTSHYGPIFEMWFDGACGGTGYYGGKGGKRSITYNTYYGWKEIHAIIRKNQPNCAIWCGQYDENGRTHYADCRWGGSEAGFVNDPCWNALSSEKPCHAGTGVRAGDAWCPAEGDVSIRPGWFWHASQNQEVKTPQRLMNIYLSCVGRGANLILNLPPDRRGIIHENDVSSLTAYGDHLRQTFADNLAKGAKLTASNTRGNNPFYGPQNLLDTHLWSAWVTDDAVLTPEVVLELKGAKTFNMIRLREDIRLGQRIEGIAVDAFVDGIWKEIANAPNIGAIRLCRVPQTTTTRVRVRITKSPVCPALSDFGLFLEPEWAVGCPPIADPKSTH